MILTDLICDRCMAVVERYAALTGPPDALFFAIAAASGNGELCDRCEAKIDAYHQQAIDAAAWENDDAD